MVAEPPVFLFDLFGTLVPGGTREQRDAVARMVAGDLEVDPEKFAALIRDTFDERTRGLLGDLHSTLKNLAARLGEEPSSAAIERGVRRRLAMNRSLLHASWALPDLDALRAHGSLIGVVSDCSAETPAVWADSPLAGRVDATAFSCLVGVRKPAAAIYLTATAALGVDPTSASSSATARAPNSAAPEHSACAPSGSTMEETTGATGPTRRSNGPVSASRTSPSFITSSEHARRGRSAPSSPLVLRGRATPTAPLAPTTHATSGPW